MREDPLVPLKSLSVIRTLTLFEEGVQLYTMISSLKSIKPLFNNVLVKRLQETRSIGGVLLPDSARTPLQQGSVVAVGPGSYNQQGQLIPTSVSADDRVLFSDFAVQKINVAGEELLMCKDQDIIATLQ